MRAKVIAFPIYEVGQRSNQEDSLYPSPEASPSTGPLYILCDGMGGHAAGEVASQAVCSAMSDYVLSHPREDDRFDENDFVKALEHAYAALDEKDTDDERKMGTTLAFAMFHDGGCFVAHIGDSRIYHIRPSEHQILYVSRDHSLVNELVELGELTPEEAKTSRQKNVITRAMQPHQDSPAKADWTILTDLKAGDYIYLCSDGMLEQMDDQEIVDTLALSKTDEEKIGILKAATRDNKDNHSAFLIHLTDDRPGKKNLVHGGSRLLILAIVILVLAAIAAIWML